jgi:hypothetical protein
MRETENKKQKTQRKKNNKFSHIPFLPKRRIQQKKNTIHFSASMFYYERKEVHTPRCDKQKKQKESGVPGSYNTCFFGGFPSGKLE